ncbi:hypothetical protein QZM22_09240 [Burkholderia oklahomensis]|nr:hypothetical protein [Burkholderia oklahomensis]MDN7672697.1 hypothetical protein [Burkholderia oklahomensis]
MTFGRRRERLRVVRAVDAQARGPSITPITPITHTALELGYGSEQLHDAIHAAPALGRRAIACGSAMRGTAAGRKALRASRRRMERGAPAACARCLRVFYTPLRTFDLPFTRDPLTFHRFDLEHGETKMDAVYIGGLALFTGLILALIAGCEKLAQYGRGGRS